MITKLEQLITEVRKEKRQRIVAAYAQDLHTIESLSRAVDLGIVEATLVGDVEIMKDVCKENNIEASKFKMIQGNSDVECVEQAIKAIHAGQADILMKGLVSTDKYMRGILNKEWGLLPVGGVLSHVTVLELPMYHKLLVVSDVAVIPYPDIKQKIAITKYLIKTANILGIERPNVAVIAPSEQMLPAIESCVHAAILSKMGDRGEFGNADVEGPLSLDVALCKEIAEIKKLYISVAGEVDCMLFPTLDAANVFFKSANQLIKAPLAAMVVGTKCPCVLTSRGDSTQSKLYSIALGALSAARK